ncbi:MAG: thiamine-phosphate kinase [Acidobacteriota bacterium]|jgi:thiamine-monophosphate kinase|nr:thiamine-phosphate kinase [Acidobacteriota bacterium]
MRAGENAIVELLKHHYAAADCPTLEKGIGDDAAVWRPCGAGELWAVTTDMLVEEVDFRHGWSSPQELGYKSLAANLSDLAAMGARPRFFTVSLALPPDVTEKWVQRFYDGLADCGGRHGAALVGGDLSSGGETVVSITAFGESQNRKVVYRSGGRAGDLLYVTGVLGKSAAGLELLRQGTLRSRSGARREALQAHRKPEPRCAVGAWLAQSGCARAMMDLSDGLAADLPRLCAASGASGTSGASGLDAEIFPDRIPTFAPSASWGCDPLQLALGGGEDYELLFAVPRAKRKLLETGWPPDFPVATHIGNLINGDGRVWLAVPEGARRPLQVHGFDHFLQR